jgi:uncharacterized protein (DUF697 family)
VSRHGAAAEPFHLEQLLEITPIPLHSSMSRRINRNRGHGLDVSVAHGLVSALALKRVAFGARNGSTFEFRTSP